MLTAKILCAFVLFALAVPVLVPPSDDQRLAEASEIPPSVDAILFPDPMDTSVNVTEYPLVSRALMVGGGSSDVEISDLNGDGQSDLMVSSYALKTISIFYRGLDGKLPTYPSFNITTQNNPMSIAPIDVFASGGHQIVSLEREPVFSTPRFTVYNLTSESSYEIWPDHSTNANARSFIVGNLSGDKYPDIAVASAGANPTSSPGRLEVFFGPSFATNNASSCGLGTEAVVSGDFNDDGSEELAVANYYSSTVMIFDRPYELGGAPSQVLTVSGNPSGLASGRLDGDALDDLAVITQTDPAVRFFFQSLGALPSVEDYNRTLDFEPSFVLAANMSGSAEDDLLLLSKYGNLTAGLIQGSSIPLWPMVPDFRFPTGTLPSAAAIGDADGDLLPDIVVASAGMAWAGSSIGLYPNRSPYFSNSNATSWINRSAVPSEIAAGDIDGDDVQDLVVLNRAARTVDYFISFGGIPRTVDLDFTPSRMLVSDLNGDEYRDVLVTMQDGSLIRILFGGISFPDSEINLTCGNMITSIAIDDLNDDELLDILAATGDGQLDIFFNNGGPDAFGDSYEVALTPGAGIWAVTVGDFNSDGLNDIAYTRSIRKVVVLLQQPGVPFDASSPGYTLSHTVGSDFTSLWCGDITGDDKADIVAMRPYDGSMYLFDQDDFVVAPHPFGTLDLPEVPKYVSVQDVTDDGHADVIAIFGSADLLFLYRQAGVGLPATPSAAFVTGAEPVYARIGDATHDNRGDLLVLEAGSRSVSAWEQINRPPEVDAGGPYVTRQGSELQINGTVKTGTSEIPYMEYFWDFGDGNVSGWIKDVTPTHTYADVRNYTISVIAVDPGGEPAFDQANVTVLDSVPLVSFSWTPENPSEGQLVSFLDTTSSYDPVSSRRWIVDGVYTGDESNLTLEFQDGTHEVTLEVTDTDGSIGNKTYFIYVQSQAPDVRIDAPPSALEGSPVTFVAFVDEWHGVPVDTIVSYEWDYSYVPGIFVPDPYAPNSNTTTHVFSAESYPEYYRIASRVTDIDGMSAIATWDLAIFDVGPIAGLVLNATDPQEGVPFRFISTTDSFDGIVDWNWTLTYPDGHSSSFYVTDTEMAAMSFANLQDGDYSVTLIVREFDGNTSSYTLGFHVTEIPPFVDLSTVPVESWDGYYEEFYDVVFVADVTGLDPAVMYEWDFVAPGAEFEADAITTANTSTCSYTQVGNYTAKVRVTDSDGSVTTQQVSIEIRHKPFRGEFFGLVESPRDFSNTSNVTFGLGPLLVRYPDVVRVVYDFGDGAMLTVINDLQAPVKHSYALGSDYHLNITVTDDDGYSFLLSAIIGNRPPAIQILSPWPDYVIRSGTPIVFLITPYSAALLDVVYHIDGGGPMHFGDMYQLNTSGWIEGPHSVLVVAGDQAGTVSRLETRITIDDVAPSAFVYTSQPSLFGGSRVNITVRVHDQNVEASGIVLYVRFQGETAFSAFTVGRYDGGTFYRVLDLPVREGNISFYAFVSDLAGNSVQTPLYTSAVELHFLTVAWPYLLTIAVLAFLGVSGYFVREGRIAVDETFVIYNDGRLISHSTRRLKPGMDDQVLGSMFVAIQDFVKDSFKDITSFTLRKIEFGPKSVLVEKGEHLFLAVILHGQASRKVALKMQKAVSAIEKQFGQVLKDWDGDLDKVRGVNDIVKGVYSKAPVFPRRLRNKT